jgi:hypothetical protein
VESVALPFAREPEAASAFLSINSTLPVGAGCPDALETLTVNAGAAHEPAASIVGDSDTNDPTFTAVTVMETLTGPAGE